MQRWLLLGAKAAMAAFVAAGVAACGGGGGGTSSSTALSTSSTAGLASNAIAVSVSGSVNGRIPNLPYVSVTLCVPGTSTCQTIDNVLLDTGSIGLRLVASQVTIPLPLAQTTGGQTLGNCAQFADGYAWGAVRTADLKLNSETASSLPIQMIADSAVPTVPSSCSGTGLTAETSAADLGANGILGIGPLAQDCGTACASQLVQAYYYGCTGSTCASVKVPVANQLAQPISLFSVDNNGTVLVMPSVSSGGQQNVTGQLIFGIGTQANNGLGSAAVIKTDDNARLTINYKSNTETGSLLDSGSNGIFFEDSSIDACQQGSIGYPFYCPSSSLLLSATVTSPVTQASTAVSFTINNAISLLNANSGNNNVLPGLGCNCFADGLNGFDLGMPFFYGRSIYTAIEGMSTTGGTGPYVAF